ncbi:MAG: cupin domain-containing protein [Thermoplasmata archaeon]|nr:cupin domain-containing protein [Thermoplasmata archaeon]
MSAIEVVRADALTAGSSTRGITREKAFEEGAVLVSRSRIAGGVASDWHHHGRRRLFGILFAGRLRLEYGPHGKQAVDLEPGDFFRIPVGLVHRDVNVDPRREALVAAFLDGEGIPIVNVAGPERGA